MAVLSVNHYARVSGSTIPSTLERKETLGSIEDSAEKRIASLRRAEWCVLVPATEKYDR